MPLAFEMQGRWRPSAERFFAKVKEIAVDKRRYLKRTPLQLGWFGDVQSRSVSSVILRDPLKISSPSSLRCARFAASLP